MWITILIAFAMVAGVAACGGADSGTDAEIQYRPVLLPVKFTLDKDGVDVSGEKHLVTPIGEFAITLKKNLADRPPGSVHVIIRDRDRGPHGTDRVYLVRAGGDSIKVIVDGHTEIEVKDRQVIIDVTDGTIRSFQLARLDPVGVTEQSALEAWWDNADRQWDAGWSQSLYHPFMLTRWAYDDSTIYRWYGLGFIWFLVRLFVSVVMLLLDILLTLIFLLAQVSFYFWGATGRNIVWGLFILLIVVPVMMFFWALRD